MHNKNQVIPVHTSVVKFFHHHSLKYALLLDYFVYPIFENHTL